MVTRNYKKKQNKRRNRRKQSAPKSKNLSSPLNVQGFRDSESDFDDSMSLFSELSLDSEISFYEFQDSNSILTELLDLLFDKSSKVRLDTLKKINGHLSRRLHDEFVENSLDTLARVLPNCLRKNSVDETCEVLRTISLVTISLQQRSELFFGRIQSDLEKLLTRFDSTLSAIQAIRNLSFCVFIAGNDEMTLEIINSLFQLWHNEKLDGTIRASALRSWTFLMSKIPPPDLAPLISDYIPELLCYFDSPEMKLRCAAGECISFLCSSAIEVDDVPEDIDIDYIIEQFEEVGVMQTKTQKQTRKVQRNAFLKYVKILKGIQIPVISVKIHKNIREIKGFAPYIQYHLIKEVMGQALQPHFIGNKILQNIFGIENLKHAERISKFEKKVKQQQYQSSARDNANLKKKNRREKNAFRQFQ